MQLNKESLYFLAFFPVVASSPNLSTLNNNAKIQINFSILKYFSFIKSENKTLSARIFKFVGLEK